MTEIPSYMIQNPIFERVKPKKRCYYSSSFLYMILLSIFTYVLIFHVFEISPFSIVKNTKILFFISNTLILIIAADYGAFSDKEKHDVYGEYINNTRNRNENYTYQENTICHVKQIVPDLPRERIVRVVNEINKPVIANQTVNEIEKPVIDNQTVKLTVTCDARKPKPYGRSKSDKPRVVRNKIAKHKRFHRTESDKSKWIVVPEKWENVVEESEEYSKLSNEELNKKVEDFIQNFNREIRLQSLRS